MAGSLRVTSSGEDVSFYVAPTELHHNLVDSDAQELSVGAGLATSIDGRSRREVVLLSVDGHTTWLSAVDAHLLSKVLREAAGIEQP